MSLARVVGFVWQAGITRFLASVEAEFPVYFQHSVFILGDWGWGDWGSVCVSLKARPLPLPKCEMLHLGDAGLLLFVRPLQLRDPGQKVIAAFRGQKHAALLQSSLSYIDIYKI